MAALLKSYIFLFNITNWQFVDLFNALHTKFPKVNKQGKAENSML